MARLQSVLGFQVQDESPGICWPGWAVSVSWTWLTSPPSGAAPTVGVSNDAVTRQVVR